MGIYFQGLLLGLAYVAPIGMQNLFVIQSALSGYHKQAFFTSFFIIINDILLALACFFGIGSILDRYTFLRIPLALAGSLIIFYIVLSLWRSKVEKLKTTFIKKQTLSQLFLACFAVTWFNPQAIIDGTLLFGGMKTTLLPVTQKFFIMGVASASALWFSGITIAVLLTSKAFTPKVQVFLNKICAIILAVFGFRLLLTVF